MKNRAIGRQAQRAVQMKFDFAKPRPRRDNDNGERLASALSRKGLGLADAIRRSGPQQAQLYRSNR